MNFPVISVGLFEWNNSMDKISQYSRILLILSVMFHVDSSPNIHVYITLMFSQFSTFLLVFYKNQKDDEKFKSNIHLFNISIYILKVCNITCHKIVILYNM